jgi:hypothetical protein
MIQTLEERMDTAQDAATHQASDTWEKMDAAQDAALDALVAVHVAYALALGRIPPEEAEAKRTDIKWLLRRQLREHGLV